MTAAEAHARIMARDGSREAQGVARCPVPGHGQGRGDRTPSLGVTLDGDRLLVRCHAGCPQDDVVEALKAAGCWPSRPDGPAAAEWREIVWRGPDGNRVQLRRLGLGEPKCRWREKGGIKPRRLIWTTEDGPLTAGDGPVLIAEGEKAAAAAARKTGLAAAALAAASILPDVDVLRWAGLGGRPVILWPDNDPPGAGIMQRLSLRLGEIGCETVVVDNDLLLGGEGQPGWDAADWRTPLQPAEALAAVRAATFAVGRGGAAPSGPVQEARGIAAIIPQTDVGAEVITDIDSARALADAAAGRLAWRPASGTWCWWGAGWQPIGAASLLNAISWFGFHNYGAMTRKGGIPQFEHRPAAGGTLRLARSVASQMEGMCTVADALWDADPTLAGIDGDTIDLRTGRVRPARREDRILHRLGARPAAAAEFSKSAFRRLLFHLLPDAEIRNYLRIRLGAALAGRSGDRIIWLRGQPRSGKGTLLSAIATAFGNYAAGIPSSAIAARGGGQHLQWKYRLRGCRLATLEDPPLDALDPAELKQLTGSIVTANAMRRASVDFRLDLLVLVTSNAAPSFGYTDPGIAERLEVIECGATVPAAERDENLRGAMRMPSEQAVVLYWLIAGAVEYFRGGGSASTPEPILAETREVLRDTALTEFLEAIAPGQELERGVVWDRWREFKAHRGEHPGSARKLFRLLRDVAGFAERRSHGRRLLIAPASPPIP